MSQSVVALAAKITASQANVLAASLEIDGRLDIAKSALGPEHPALINLDEVAAEFGTAALAAMLRGFVAAASWAPRVPRAVWSGPSFEGDSDHTTAATAHLIDGATEDVFASTFSASVNSPFIDALWRAIARGVDVTVLVEGTEMAHLAEKLRVRLVGAKFLKYVAPGNAYGIQHSKVVVIDSAIALITSANFSNAAAHRNLEAGVLIHDPDFATGIRRRFTSLRAAGHLVDLV